MMEKLDLRYCIPESLTFSTFSAEEIKRLSVVKIFTTLSFNALGHPNPGGLYDPALGPTAPGNQCTTCKMHFFQCPGHFGHIELPLDVINPLYHKVINNIFKVSCLNCHRVLIPNKAKYILTYQMKLLDEGLFIEALELGPLYSNMDLDEFTLLEKLQQQYDDIKKSKLTEEEFVIPQEVRGESDLRKSFLEQAISYRSINECNFCKKGRKIQVLRNKMMIADHNIKVAGKFRNKTDDSPEEFFKYLTPKECKTHLSKIWDNDCEVLKAFVPMLKSTNENDPVSSLFMKFILVTPNNSRPCNFLDGIISEHPMCAVYKAILNDCITINTIVALKIGDKNDELDEERKEIVDNLRGSNFIEKLQFAWSDLQTNIDTLLDIEAKKSRRGVIVPGIGLKQIIEKKNGILRMNMMGKRVNFAARTVITPDPNLNIDEIGVPEAFAKKLTYPVVVTVWNVAELRKLVINGPDVHPGANFIVDESKKTIKIDNHDIIQRKSIAKRLLTPGDKPGYKVVHRHLLNGDVLLLNRQPTLHRPSIMAHKARILKGEKTFRLHYANCKSYNADFDGDEMNAHFPQNEVARSEGYNLVSVNNQYLVPKDGTPLSGLIQDHMVSGVRLTIRGKMFSKSQYMQLVFQALPHVQGDIITLKPCILKPVELWSGKQIVSTVLLNNIPKDKFPINLSSKAKISAKAWQKGPRKDIAAGGTPFRNDDEMSEAEVIIRQGQLLSGVLDKTHYGATPYSLVHCMYELYGGDVSSAFLSSLAKLFTAFLQIDGFSLGVEDILVNRKADEKRALVIKESRCIGDTIVSEVVDIPSGSTLQKEMAQMYSKDPMFRAVIDHKYKTSLDKFTNKINGICIPNGLLSPFPDNNLQLMVQSGAKGSTVNTMQISCLLGQIELEGKRPPLMVSGKSLPSFPAFETSPRAGGFVDGRFMTGIKPQEFFFHCMAGREGLIDTAVKTSRSGYLQRCLVKHLEGLNVSYDMTVRDSDGSLLQLLYGEDGLEVTKSQFLKVHQIPFLVDNMNALRDKNLFTPIKECSELSAIKAYNKIIKKWRMAGTKTKWVSPFTLFANEMKGSVDVKHKLDKGSGRTRLTWKMCKMWYNLSQEDKFKYEQECKKTPDTLVSKFQPDRNYSSITEKMDKLIDNYFFNSTGECVKRKTLHHLISEKYLTSLCPPGEPVGLLAAQSVGEPSTQMTLNTFHFAGRGEMNVTLGIPRLREILMVASKNIKTPSMVLHFKDIPKLNHKIDKLRKVLTRITLADVLETISVHEKIKIKPRMMVYSLRMNFLPHEAYADSTSVTPKQILKYVEKRFIKNLYKILLMKKAAVKQLITEGSFEERGANKADDENDEEEVEKPSRKKKAVGTTDDYQSSEEEPEGDDDDATTARRRDRQQEEHQYSDVEDDVSVQEEVGGDANNDMDIWETVKGDETQLTEEQKEEIERTRNVLSENYIIDYKYDKEMESWCEVVIGVGVTSYHVDISSRLRDLCHSSVVHEVPGIKKAFLQTDTKTGRIVLRTDGLNLYDIFQYDKIVDFNKLYCNDIHAMANMYGIEAASLILVKEVQDVFRDYGITVDPRHLNLIASYMTFSGKVLPLSRKGMEGGASPLQQMSFESSLGFLKSAVLSNKKDDLNSPSSRLIVGTPVKSGTGSFKLFHTFPSD